MHDILFQLHSHLVLQGFKPKTQKSNSLNSKRVNNISCYFAYKRNKFNSYQTQWRNKGDGYLLEEHWGSPLLVAYDENLVRTCPMHVTHGIAPVYKKVTFIFKTQEHSISSACYSKSLYKFSNFQSCNNTIF